MTDLTERRLGRTELRPSALGLGAAWWGSSTEQETIAAIHRAMELGIDFFDTYPGPDEARWGRALAGERRQRVTLQAKVSRLTPRRSDHSAAATRTSLEESLRTLGTEHVDVVLIHGYDQPQDLDRDDMVDPLAPGNALDELRTMQAEGKVRHIGMGGRAHQVLQRGIDTGHIEVVLTYLEYNLLTQAAARDLFPICRARDVGVELASPLGMGLLTGSEPTPEEERRKIPGQEPRAAAMVRWCQARGVDIRHLAIQFCLAAPVESIVMPGPASMQELEEVFAAATQPLPDEIWQEFAIDFGVNR